MCFEVVLQNSNVQYSDPQLVCNRAAVYATRILISDATADFFTGWECKSADTNTVRVCGTATNTLVAQQISDEMSRGGEFPNPLIDEFINKTRLREFLCGGGGLVFRLLDSDTQCYTGFEYSPACSPAKVPFPFCACDKKRGSLPFAVDYYFENKDYANSTYCFAVSTVDATGGTCSGINTLRKVEMYIDLGFKWRIASVTNGRGRKLKTAWGPKGEDALRITDLDWTKEWVEANPDAAKICITTDKKFYLPNACLGPNRQRGNGVCYSVTFDEGKRCCPLTAGEIPPVDDSGVAP